MWSKEIFSQRVSLLRQKVGLSQKELGELTGLSRQAVSDIERGERLTSIEGLNALADYFDVSTDYLLGRSDEQ